MSVLSSHVDAERTMRVLEGGEIAIVPLDVAYAVVGGGEASMRRIFTANGRNFFKLG